MGWAFAVFGLVLVVAFGSGTLEVTLSAGGVALSGVLAVWLARRGQIALGFAQLAILWVSSLYYAHVVIAVSLLAPAFTLVFVAIAATLFPRATLPWVTAAMVAAVLGMRLSRPLDDTWMAHTMDILGIVLLTAIVIYVDRRRVDRDRALLMEVSDQARAAEESARRANDAKSEFLARVSHELRTPINAILGYAELVQEETEDEGLPEEVTEDLGRIRTAGRSLLELVDRVLDLARVESGRLEVRAERVALCDLVAPTIEVVRPLVDGNHNTIQVDVADSEVVVDASVVRQILLNLLSNAARFTQDGTVVLRGGRVGEELVLEVEDSGIGIPAHRIPHLFEPFVQAEAETAYRYGGTGLGLAIVDRQVRAMGGRIEVESQVGRGSTFRVRLPQPAAA